MHFENYYGDSDTSGVRLPSEVSAMNSSVTAGIHPSIGKQCICDHLGAWTGFEENYEEKEHSSSVNWKWNSFPLEQNH